jgi:hypothetical protein
MQRGLLSRHGPSDLVAFGAAGVRSARDLARDVARVAAALPSGPAGGQVLLVIRSDRYALAVAILAAWARGYVPVLPPELDRDAITALASADPTVCVLHDTASGIPLQIATLLAAPQESHAAALELDLALAECSFEARSYARATDGSLTTQRWGGDWLRQARELAGQLELAPGQRCATSVGSEHAHGAVLGVLVPLLTGAAFLRETLAARLLGGALSGLHVDLLITVPAHVPALLEGAAEAGAVPLPSPPPKGEGTGVARVVSALGELPRELAEAGQSALGGVWSDLTAQAGDIPILRCLENEETPRAAAGGAREEEIERVLRARDDVRDVAAVTVPNGSRVCVALVRENPLPGPLPEGEGIGMEGEGTLELLEVNRIRRDGIGRAQRGEVLRQFGLKPDGSAVNFALRWAESTRREHAGGVEHRTRVEVPSDYGYFDGHFAGYPILPGAAQLSELVLPCVRRAWPELGALKQMARLKFTGRIQPGETIDVVLNARTGSTSVDFALKRAEVLCSAGTLSFTESTGEVAR